MAAMLYLFGASVRAGWVLAGPVIAVTAELTCKGMRLQDCVAQHGALSQHRLWVVMSVSWTGLEF
jgi:hypothetical protein